MKKLVVFLFAIGMLAIPLSSFADVNVAGLPTMTGANTTFSSQHNTFASANGNTMNVIITGGQGAVAEANWNTYNVAAGKTVEYNFTAANQTSINRVNATGGLSKIEGTIQGAGVGASTGKVILLNPNGFVFGKGAVVNLNSFTASTLNGTYDLKSKQINLTNGNNNAGKITVQNGAKIQTTKNVHLVAGKGGIEIQNGAYLEGKTGSVNLYTGNAGSISYKDNGHRAGSTFNNGKTDTNMNISVGKATLQGGNVRIYNNSTKGNVSLSGANVQAKGYIDAKSNNTLNVKSSTLNATGNVNLVANNANHLSSNKITSDKKINIKSNNSYVEVWYDDSEVKAKGDVNINGKTSVYSLDGKITSENGNVNLTSGNGYVTTLNSTINADKDVNISGEKGTEVDSSKITATNGTAFIESVSGDITLKNNKNIEAGANVLVYAGGKTTATKNTIKAGAHVSFETYTGNIQATGNNIQAGLDVNLDADKNLNITNNTINSGNNVTLQARNGNITSKNGSITASKNIKLTAKNNISTEYANINSTNGSVNITAQNGNIDMFYGSYQNKAVQAKGNVSITAKGDTTIFDSNISSSNGKVNISSKNAGVTIYGDKNSVSAKKDVNVKAKNNISISRSNISSSDGVVDVESTKGTVNSHDNTYTGNAVYITGKDTGNSFFFTGKEKNYKTSDVTLKNDQININKKK